MIEDPNHWQSRRAQSPEQITGADARPDQPCPNCGHLLDQHSVDLGCHVGWEYGGEGCECPMSLALQYNPNREAEVTGR